MSEPEPPSSEAPASRLRLSHADAVRLAIASLLLVSLACLFPHAKELGPWFWVILATLIFSLLGLTLLGRQPESNSSGEAQEIQDRVRWLQAQVDQLQQDKRALASQLVEELEMHLPDSSSPRADLDQQLELLLQEETQRLFQKIRDNHFVVEGSLDLEGVWQQFWSIARNVAGLYRKDSPSPLLHTNAEQVLRALNRATLHLLILFEQLPLNLKSRDFNELYGVIRKLTRMYELYRWAEPAFPYASGLFNLGRLAAGANPVSLAAWWGLSQLGQKGLGEAARQVLDRQVITFLTDVVQVLGREIANIYDPSHGRRTPQWILARELVEAASATPLNRAAFQALMKALMDLRGISEFDRLQCLRALSLGKGLPLPSQAVELAPEARREIAERLTHLLQTCLEGAPSKEAQAWRQGVEDRLGLRLGGSLQTPGGTGEAQAMASSLAGFLHQHTELPPEKCLTLAAEAFPGVASLYDCPTIFDPPDLSGGTNSARSFFQKLCQVAAPLEPTSPGLLEHALACAAWLGLPRNEAERKMREQVREAALRASPSPPRFRDLDPVTCRNWLQWMHENPDTRAAFGPFHSEETHCWLIQRGPQWELITLPPESQLLWKGPQVQAFARIRGHWPGEKLEFQPPGPARTFVGTPPLGRRAKNWFAPLLESDAIQRQDPPPSL